LRALTNLFPLPVDRAQLLFLLAGHAHQRERSTIALDKAIHGNELTEQRFAESNRLTIITRLKDTWTMVAPTYPEHPGLFDDPKAQALKHGRPDAESPFPAPEEF
jgi:hypothetical protein